jgi:tetratricopeptide (TPR) repeat protein
MKKYAWFCGCLLLFSITLKAQDRVINLADQYKLAKQQFEQQAYTQAIQTLAELIPQVEAIAHDTTVYYEMLNMQGLSYEATGQTEKALPLWLRTVSYYTASGKNTNHSNHFLAVSKLAEYYFDQKEYPKAEQYYQSALAIEAHSYGTDTEDYFILLQNYLNTTLAQRKVPKSDSIYQRLQPLYKSTAGAQSLEYAVFLKRYGDFKLQYEPAKRKNGEALYQEAAAIFTASGHTASKEYTHILLYQATALRQQLNYTGAAQLYREIAATYRQQQLLNTQEYATCIQQLAQVYKAQNKFSEAENLLDSTLYAFRRLNGEKNILYIHTLSSQAGLYTSTGQYQKAEAAYRQSQTLFLQTLGEKNIDYANLLNNMALFYEETGRYDEATAYMNTALKITQDLVGKNHVLYATTLSNKAVLETTLGNYEVAEPIYKEALAVRQNLLGTQHPDYGTSLNNLAVFYEKVGRLPEAEPLYQQALQIAKSVYGTQHYEYAVALNNLGNLYEATGRYTLAQKNYTEALAIVRAVLGENHPQYGATLLNLAYAALSEQKYDEAEKYFAQDRSIIAHSLGTQHPRYAKALANLALVYEHSEQYSKAEQNYQEALQIIATKLGTQHPDYTSVLANMARVYTAQGQLDKAAQAWKKTLGNFLEEIQKYFPSMSEKEKEIFYEKFSDRFEQFNSFAVAYSQSNPAILADMYHTQMATKALLFNASQKVRQRILNSQDAALIQLYQQWQTNKETLAQLYNQPDGISLSFAELEKKVNEQEKELSLKSELFKSANENQNYSWQDIRALLKTDEAAIEIIRFRKYKAVRGGTYVQYKDGKEQKDSIYYAALVITKESTRPVLILLTNGYDLENRFLTYYTNTIKFNVEDLYGYTNYWSQITKALPGIRKVYLSPDGVYNKINLQSLYNPESKQYVLDELSLQTVTNTKDLLTFSAPAGASKKVVLLGNPTFVQASASQALKPLPGSEVEVQKIDQLFRQHQWASMAYTGTYASEDLLKTVRDARIIHIATHGYFEKDQNKNSTTAPATGSSHPLLRSGLHLTPGKNSDDGTLTAYEAMNLQLDRTDLVVLSACETGLGTIKNGEGVYGIQRAFRVAGARSIVISLWKVDDEATQKLMTLFYEEWLKSGKKRAAFESAQKQLRLHYKEPFYWGAFVMIGE